MKILIVDDNRDDRRLLRYIVEKKGHKSIEAEDGLEGLRMAKLHTPDLIISDALMPIMDGFQFLKTIKEDERLRPIPFIFYSAIYKADKDVDLAIALGAEAYIIKPKEPADFWEEVEIILRGQKAEKVITPELITEEEDYLKRYSQVVAAKLEEKVAELQKEIIERKRAEAESIKAKEEWERTFDAITDPIMVLDTRHKIIKANKAMAEALKITPEEAMGLSCYKAVHGTEEPPVFCPHSRLLEDGQPHSVEVSEPRLGGHFIISVSPLFTPEGVLYGSIHYARDITERKQKEEELKKTNELLERVFSTTHILIAYLDREFNFIKVNRAYAEADGRDPSFFIGKNHFSLYPDEENEAIFRRVVETGEPFTVYEKPFEYTGHPERGVTYWDWSLVPALDSTGRVESLVFSLKDVTERKRAEEEMVRLYQQVKDEAEISTSLLSTFQALNSSLDERELIKTVVDLAPRFLKVDRIGIFLYDESVKGFVFSGGYGFRPDEDSILLSRTFREGDFPAMDKAVRGDTVVIKNAAETDLISKELVDAFGIRAAVIVPIPAREKVMGGIYSDFKTSRPIEERDISFLKGLADGIAIALQNSRLYRESVERLMELSGKIETIKAMAQLDREILSTIDRGTILRSAVALVSRIIPCERAAVLLLEGDNYRVISEWGVGRFLDTVYSVKKSHFDAPGIKSGSLFIPDLASDTTDCLYHREQNAIGIKACLLVPLVTKDEMIGLLDIGSTFHGRLAPAHLSTAENIASQITVALENARLYEDLQQLLINTITSLASAIDAKSPWTKGHSERVTQYALQIGKELELQNEDLERLKLSGLLHDVGKIGTYDILLDKPAKLTDEEFELVRKHPQKGAEILAPIKQLTDVIPGVRYHHERYDGKGYPDGLKGEEIPLQARILCVADSFDSMTADRPYRPSPGKEYAISEFRRCSGTQFDPKVVDAFLKVLHRANGLLP